MPDIAENSSEDIIEEQDVLVSSDDENAVAEESFDDESITEDVLDAADETTASNSKYVTGQMLYETILRHPDWRVVQASKTGPDVMHPLMFIYDQSSVKFQHDATSTQFHPHGCCDDILDLLGTEGIPESYGRKPVVIGELHIENWKDESFKVRKVTLDASAKWIKLHVAE